MSSQEHITLDSIIVQSTEVVSTGVDDGQIILSIQNGKYYGVTAVGERIWELSQEPVSLRAICDTLMAEFEVERQLCEAQLLEFVGEMSEQQIITVQS